MILSFLTMNKVLITNISINMNQSKLDSFYPIIFTLIVLIVFSGTIKLIQRKKAAK